MTGPEDKKGTYALVYRCRGSGSVQIGRLGALQLRPGWYVYVGSAFGSGGVRARIRHHAGRSARPHWHIDYLKPHCVLVEIWVEYSMKRYESSWADRLAGCKRSSIPLAGFGASDARAESHLFHFMSRPAPAVIGARRPIVIEAANPSIAPASRITAVPL